MLTTIMIIQFGNYINNLTYYAVKFMYSKNVLFNYWIKYVLTVVYHNLSVAVDRNLEGLIFTAINMDLTL